MVRSNLMLLYMEGLDDLICFFQRICWKIDIFMRRAIQGIYSQVDGLWKIDWKITP